MKRELINVLHEAVVSANFHRDSEHKRSISTTTLIGPAYKAAKRLHRVEETHPLEPMKMRSAAIGTGFHAHASTVIAEMSPSANYDFFYNLYGTIPDDFKEQLHEEYITQRENV